MIEQVSDNTVIVGTAHVSPKSVQQVEETIRSERPDKVLVELDPKRYEALRDPDAWQQTDIIQILREKRQHVFMVQLYLANMQARMGQETGVAPGGELLKAIEVAEEVGSEVVLIDRDVTVTLKRGFGTMNLRQRLSLFMNVLMEMLPGIDEDAPEPDRKKQTLTNFFTVGALTLLLAFSSAGAWLMERVGNVFDALIGYTTVPLLTMVVLGVLAGALITAGCPPWRKSGPPPEPWWTLHAKPWPAFILGLLAVWAVAFMDGGSPEFFGRLLPGVAPAAGAAIATMLAIGGTWSGYRMVAGLRNFEHARAAMNKDRETDIDALLEQDAVTAMTEEFAHFAPTIKTALIDERDEFMATHIREQSTGSKVVAVVGAGHMQGIKRHLREGTPDRRDELMQVPRRLLTFGKILGIALPAFILGAFIYMGVTGAFAELKDSIIYWILVNGTLSALGAFLARAHIFSILVAFLAAPLTSLSPALAAGWFAGLTEAKMHTPTVKDFEDIKTLETWKDFWRNSVIRVLLVTALANLGSVAGTWLGAFEVVRNLGGLP